MNGLHRFDSFCGLGSGCERRSCKVECVNNLATRPHNDIHETLPTGTTMLTMGATFMTALPTALPTFFNALPILFKPRACSGASNRRRTTANTTGRI